MQDFLVNGGRGNVMPYTVEELKQIISPIAAEHGINRVCLFGSYARGIATGESDVDIMIDKGNARSLFQLSGFRLAVEDALCLPVDLVTNEASDQRLLQDIKKDEVLLYQRT
jgi:hypothetical protein